MERELDRPWTDTSAPPADRVESLLGEMTLDEKVAQLGSGNVAPMQEAFAHPPSFEEANAHGLGHLTRPLGTASPSHGGAR